MLISLVKSNNPMMHASKHYLWPIPQGEIDKNAFIVQNKDG